MAEVPVRIDDLDGTSADEEITFGIGGKWMVIDLSKSNADTFREVMQPWIEAARPIQSAQRKTRTKAHRDRSAAIRVWAQQNGMDVGDRGRLKAEIIRRYDNRMAA